MKEGLWGRCKVKTSRRNKISNGARAMGWLFVLPRVCLSVVWHSGIGGQGGEGWAAGVMKRVLAGLREGGGGIQKEGRRSDTRRKVKGREVSQREGVWERIRGDRREEARKA